MMLISWDGRTGLRSLATQRDLVLGGPPHAALQQLLSRIGRCPQASFKLSANAGLPRSLHGIWAEVRTG